MGEILKDANLLVKDEFADKNRFYTSPLMEIRTFNVCDIVLTSPGDIGGDNEFIDDFN